MGIKRIQTFVFDKKAQSFNGWLFNLLIPGKDHIDICYDDVSDIFIYSYRGKQDFDVDTIIANVNVLDDPRLQEGEIKYLSEMDDHHQFGDSHLCCLLDKKRNIVITILKGSTKAGIAVRNYHPGEK